MTNATGAPTYAVIGAGFSGIAVAVQLLRRLDFPARVCLINRNHRFGRGMAYGTRSGSHLLNVPAGRMSLDPEDDDAFVRYLRQQGLPYRGSDFVPRRLYGDYLEAALEQAQARAARGVALELVQAEVRSMEAAPGAGVRLRLSDGRSLDAAETILALGNFAPRPPCAGSAWSRESACNDPWAAAALDHLPQDSSVLLAGTGLTAYDVVLALLDRGHRGPITLMSRRGLMPQSHREQESAPSAGLVPADALQDAATPREQLRAVRDLLAAAVADGHDWRDVIAGLRPHTPRLWQQLDERGRRQFMRHVLPYWDTHRHRAAPDIFRRVRAAMASGQLTVVAGRLLAIDTPSAGTVEVRWRPRGQSEPMQTRFDAIVNCTGPSGDLRQVDDPLIRQLLADGSIKADPLGLGLEVDADYRVLRQNGEPLEGVRYVGPLLKARLWEATAVPELRAHAARLAGAVVQARETSHA